MKSFRWWGLKKNVCLLYRISLKCTDSNKNIKDHFCVKNVVLAFPVSENVIL